MADLFLGGLVDPQTHKRTTDDATSHVTVATDSLTTHGVIVGMTGSGKTGLGVVLIEEVLRAGLPVLAIDPKGDLINLCLLFPDLAPTDFRPWIDEAQAANAGQTPDEFAASQAELWRNGLAGWGLDGAAIGALRNGTERTVYTPGSQAGVPLNIVGSLQVPEDMSDTESVADEIEGYVTGLLGLVGISADPLASREHILLSNLIQSAWAQGRSLDLMSLVGQVPSPPIRKLGVFDIDQFFPANDRMALAMKLNGLLASPAFASWAMGPALDIGSMLYDPNGRGRCAIVTTAHLSDEERQFVTSLVLSKLVTWMRHQSGTTDLRALLYMDEVAGYLPPTATPPTKKPIMLLMKQARAFGVGVVLSTQNPVDVDYKAMSNAGTWMVGRLQTERDKARLLEGMTSAAGDVDISTIDATISGLGKREFVLRRADKNAPEIITSRWAMSYLRGPMTRDQIKSLTAPTQPGALAATAPDATSRPAEAPAGPMWNPPAAPQAAPAATPDGNDAERAPGLPAAGAHDDGTSPVAPPVASGIAVRYIDPAAPWLGDAGGDSQGTTLEAAIVARVAVRYDETKADDLVHDEEFEAVVFPLAEPADVASLIQVDYDDRDLRSETPADAMYRIPAAPLGHKPYFTGVERDLRDHLTRSLSIEIPANPTLKIYGRPGETAEEFAGRCASAADERADAEIAKLRDKYEARATKLRDQIEAAEERVDVAKAEASGKRNSEMFSTAGSLLDGLLGGKKSKGGMLGDVLGDMGGAARRRGSTTASQRRVDAASGKVQRLAAQYDELEAELETDIREIAARWDEAAARTETMTIGLEKTDVVVTQICLAWLPVS